MTFHKPDYCRGIAMVLQGESLRAGSYVSHNASLGVLREKVVRRLIHENTPSRFHVDTGLIRSVRGECTSRQCDILVHESATYAPFYRWEDFVVVRRSEARAVVEVKSNLNQQTFDEVLGIQSSLMLLQSRAGRPDCDCIPLFAYALHGVHFRSFVKYLQDAVEENALGRDGDDRVFNWPVCLAVQERNYLAIRPLQKMTELDSPMAICAVDFSQAENSQIDGIETGHFIEFYSHLLGQPDFALFAEYLYRLFNDLNLPDSARVWITSDGAAHTGYI